MRLPALAIAAMCACGSSSTAPPSASSPQPPTQSSSGPQDKARALRDTIVRVNAHVIILKSGLTFMEYRDVIHTVEGIEGVVAATPFVFLELRIASAGHAPIEFAMKGIDLQGAGSVLDLEPMLKVGKLSDLAQGEPSALMVGDALARSLGVHTGDRVTVTSSPEGQPSDQPPREVPFRITGILHTDLDVYDEQLAFAPLAAAQRIADRGDNVTGVAVKVKDIARSDQIAKAIERALGGPPYAAMDWYELNRGLFGDRRP